LATLYRKTMTIVTIKERIMMINGAKKTRSSLWLRLAKAKRKILFAQSKTVDPAPALNEQFR